MIYARFRQEDSDVYVYLNPKGIVCGMCYFGDNLDLNYLAETTQEMIDHLKAHQKAGQTVPTSTFETLLLENPFPPKTAASD